MRLNDVLGSEVGFDSLRCLPYWLVILGGKLPSKRGDPVPSVASCLDGHCIYWVTLVLHTIEEYTTVLVGLL